MQDPTVLNGAKLWDEIIKAIVSTMPSQLFPLFKEVYGREYPEGTSITLVATETSSFLENSLEPPSSTLMDIALLVAGTDYYHLECQMKNDKKMVVRMFAYDVRFAINYSKTLDRDTGEITLTFPSSVVIYPEKNGAIPDHLQCRVIFQDNSEHIYKIPTVRIQTYSLEELRKKHLTLFIPYTILHLRPKLKAGLKRPLTRKELTEYVEEVIFVLKEELSDGYLSDREYQYYMKLFQHAADRVLAHHPQMQKEVHRMTEPLIKLTSELEDELLARIDKAKEELAIKKEELAIKSDELAMKNDELAMKKAELADVQAQLTDMQTKFTEQETVMKEQGEQIQKLLKLVNELTAASNP